MENKIITDAIRERIEKELRKGSKLELRLRSNKDGTEELILYKTQSEKLNIE